MSAGGADRTRGRITLTRWQRSGGDDVRYAVGTTPGIERWLLLSAADVRDLRHLLDEDAKP